MATKANLLTLLSSTYLSVGTPTDVNGGAEDEHGIREYVINVAAIDTETYAYPVLTRHSVVMAVQHEGEDGEVAAFKAELPGA